MGHDSNAIRVTATPSHLDALLCHLQREDVDPAVFAFLIRVNNRYIVRT